MAITSQVDTNNTLEQFRVEFNKLRNDVSSLEAGTINYTLLPLQRLHSVNSLLLVHLLLQLSKSMVEILSLKVQLLMHLKPQ